MSLHGNQAQGFDRPARWEHPACTRGYFLEVVSQETQFLSGVSLLPQASAEGMPLWDLQVNGKLARKFEPVTTRGLINQ